MKLLLTFLLSVFLLGCSTKDTNSRENEGYKTELKEYDTWWKEEMDEDVKHILRIDTSRIIDRKSNLSAMFVKYWILGDDPSLRLFNKTLYKKYNEIEKAIRKSFKEYKCDKDMRCELGIYKNDLKYVSSNTFSIIIKTFENKGSDQVKERWYYENYVIRDNIVQKLEFADLFTDTAVLGNLSYDLETGRIAEVKKTEKLYKGLCLNFGEYAYQLKYVAEKPAICFSFTRYGIALQIQQSVYSVNSYLPEALKYKVIPYKNLRPYLKPEIYQLVASE